MDVFKRVETALSAQDDAATMLYAGRGKETR